MAVKIRLKRMGKIRTPFYRIVVSDARTKRDGRVIEEIGTYNPKTDPSLINVNSDRAQHWLSVGAQPSEPVLALLRKTGDWQQFKGEPAPPPLLEQKPRQDRLAAFNDALKQAHGDGATEAVTAKRADPKPDRKGSAKARGKADPQPGQTPDGPADTAEAPGTADAADTAARGSEPVSSDDKPAEG